jgi:hypothetical protein
MNMNMNMTRNMEKSMNKDMDMEINMDMDEVCSESNAQGEITSIQNILEPQLF